MLKKTFVTSGLVIAAAVSTLPIASTASAQSMGGWGHFRSRFRSATGNSNWSGNQNGMRNRIRIRINNRNNNVAVARNGQRQRQLQRDQAPMRSEEPRGLQSPVVFRNRLGRERELQNPVVFRNDLQRFNCPVNGRFDVRGGCLNRIEPRRRHFAGFPDDQ